MALKVTYVNYFFICLWRLSEILSRMYFNKTYRAFLLYGVISGLFLENCMDVPYARNQECDY